MKGNNKIPEIATVYILSNADGTKLYTGVACNFIRIMKAIRDKSFPLSYTSIYNVNILVYFKHFSCFDEAIASERFLRKCSRVQKIVLIENQNEQWTDLWPLLIFKIQNERKTKCEN